MSVPVTPEPAALRKDAIALRDSSDPWSRQIVVSLLVALEEAETRAGQLADALQDVEGMVRMARPGHDICERIAAVLGESSQ